jgi:TPR repeat protein
VLQQNRPFRCIGNAKTNSSLLHIIGVKLRSAAAQATVVLTIFIGAPSHDAASAQTISPSTSATSVEDIRRKATDAFSRGDYATAWALDRQAAEQGDVNAQRLIGMIYLGDLPGLGISKNYTEAFKWFKKAAEQGDLHSQLQIGVMYKYGWGVRKDSAPATAWWRKAAEQGPQAKVDSALCIRSVRACQRMLHPHVEEPKCG